MIGFAAEDPQSMAEAAKIQRKDKEDGIGIGGVSMGIVKFILPDLICRTTPIEKNGLRAGSGPDSHLVTSDTILAELELETPLWLVDLFPPLLVPD
jgi:hypothetical protein